MPALPLQPDWRGWSNELHIAKLRVAGARAPRERGAWIRLRPIRQSPTVDTFGGGTLRPVLALDVFLYGLRLAPGDVPPDGPVEFWTPWDDGGERPFMYYDLNWVEWRGSTQQGVALPRYENAVGKFMFVRAVGDTSP